MMTNALSPDPPTTVVEPPATVAAAGASRLRRRQQPNGVARSILLRDGDVANEDQVVALAVGDRAPPPTAT